jgi:hypothetical protein
MWEGKEGSISEETDKEELVWKTDRWRVIR